MRSHKTILYADDDSDDRSWVAEASKAIDYSFHIHFVDTGKAALEFLQGLDPDQFPSLIVLDLNMPELDGRQTLRHIKSHQYWQNIPVVIVTTSSNSVDKEICKRLGACQFITKPDTYRAWQEIIRQFEPHIQ